MSLLLVENAHVDMKIITVLVGEVRKCNVFVEVENTASNYYGIFYGFKVFKFRLYKNIFIFRSHLNQ